MHHACNNSIRFARFAPDTGRACTKFCTMAPMDNLSHAVTGLAAGELLHRCLPAEPEPARQRTRHRLLLTACALASNFPDLDLIFTHLLPAPLGYLLHHRGHTHTILFALPQALLLCALIWLLWPGARRLLKASKPARTGLCLAVTIGFGLHLAMDYLNSYGLHPFFPFDGRWLYGDLVFILEPVFWISFGVPLAMLVQRPLLRLCLLLMLMAAPLFFTVQGFLTWYSMAALVLLAVVLGTIQAQTHGRTGLAGMSGVLAAFLVLGCFIGLQASSSSAARQTVMAAARASNPGGEFLDAAMSSFPTNFACWAFVSVEKNETAGTYRLQRGIVSLLPARMPAAACPIKLTQGANEDAASPAIAILSSETGSLATLRQLDQENCHFAAWMRFSRAPSVARQQASDARFDNGLRDNFSTLRFEDFKNQACPAGVPQWDKPRQDLLTPATK